MAAASSYEAALASTPRAPDEGPALGRLPLEVRPNESLLTYYVLTSLLLGPFFFLLLIPRLFRYNTLRYRIDDEGISMEWGLLFHREISLSYARIQDIHLSSNVVERRLGLGKIEIQTASASAGAEMTIEGVPGLERMRDFLYGKMRGAKGGGRTSRAGAGASEPTSGLARPGSAGHASDELAAVLLEVVEEVRGLRRDLAGGMGSGEGSGRG